MRKYIVGYTEMQDGEANTVQQTIEADDFVCESEDGFIYFRESTPNRRYIAAFPVSALVYVVETKDA